MVILLVFAYRFFSIYEFRSGDCLAGPAPAALAPAYPPRLVVMSYNIQGHAALLRGGHIAAVAATINRLRPDIVGVNEAHRSTWQARFRDQVEELRRRTGMNVVFGESYEQLGGQYGNAILTRGRIVSHDLHKLPGTGEPRTLLEAKIAIDGGTVLFYVTHLAAWEKLNRDIRMRQIECVARHIRSSTHPSILAGDLNAGPDSPELARFQRDEGFRMVSAPAATHRLTELTIDYVFADRGWQVAAARTVDEGPSDHRPVLVELRHGP
ncbi:MAG TPA: endonuclease/exonuclease/phosphatase family protein [Thermoanaerobaculia bacterium]|nr:endonuclease/exonuclease/phosphatase family protein [Thermoanaerobaculia bacterium]